MSIKRLREEKKRRREKEGERNRKTKRNKARPTTEKYQGTLPLAILLSKERFKENC